jgi:circadian clock protein KaiC
MTETEELQKNRQLSKCPTGIQGLDEITGGGLPRHSPTLVVGGPGSGKSFLGIHFLLSGILYYDERGVVVSFEQSAQEIIRDFSSVNFPLERLVSENKLFIESVIVDSSDTKVTGDYNLDGLFMRLEHAVESVQGKRIVIDGIENLFGAFENDAIVRSELHRLFRWTKERKLTTISTSEMGKEGLTRHGLEEYVADCVIVLDHRVTEEMSTRRLRVLKYRGSAHHDNEFPFLIGERGVTVLPITSLGLEYQVSNERISSGINDLDEMLEGEGFFRGSSILITGTAGTGKSTIGAHFVSATCQRVESAIYFAFEESRSQIIRNMRSVGIDLEKIHEEGLLRIIALRPTSKDLESHLVSMIQIIKESKPAAVVIDPISNLSPIGGQYQIKAMWTRVIGECKATGATALFTNLNSHAGPQDETDLAVSSLMDTWLLLRDVETASESRITLQVRKSRGMAHSRKIKELVFSNQGLSLSAE